MYIEFFSSFFNPATTSRHVLAAQILDVQRAGSRHNLPATRRVGAQAQRGSALLVLPRHLVPLSSSSLHSSIISIYTIETPATYTHLHILCTCRVEMQQKVPPRVRGTKIHSIAHFQQIKRAKEGRGSMFDESAGYRKRLFDLSFHDSFTKPGASCQPVCGAYLLHLVFFQV